ncbi:BioY family protein [Lactobacillus helveticus H10]|nr:BioY family protein [Lactobacillus helveticus H10]
MEMIPPLPLGFIPVPIVMQNLGIMLAAVILGPKKRNPGDFRVPLAGVDWFSSAQWWSGRACIFCRTNWRLFARVVINATHDRLWSFPPFINRRWSRLSIIWFAGVLLVDVIGSVWLWLVSPISLIGSLVSNLAFIPADTLKAVAVYLVAERMRIWNKETIRL